MKKLDIVGASDWVNRLFEGCGQFQWAREFLQNAIEANATKVEFGIEWEAVRKLGAYRRMIADDGCGMSSDELFSFFSNLGEGKKKIGGVHDNFGVGAKISSLPWNTNGVAIISVKDGISSMLQIVLNKETSDYELVEFEIDGELSCVIDPSKASWPEDGVDWSAVIPPWVKKNGTVVVLLGTDENPHTIFGNPGAYEETVAGLAMYLNSRFWDLTGLEVRALELRNSQPENWPKGPDESEERRPNSRRIYGAKHYLSSLETDKGNLQAQGEFTLSSGRVKGEWYLWNGDRPNVHAYAREAGYIAIRYKGELFEITSKKPAFRSFGIIDSKVQRRITLILEPQHYEKETGNWGIHPDHSRNRLNFTGEGARGVTIPMLDWGQEFSLEIPEPIMSAIREARGEISSSIEDEEYRKRLQDKFGDRWKMKTLVEVKTPETPENWGTITTEKIPAVESTRQKGQGTKRGKGRLALTSKADEKPGQTKVAPRETRVDVPKFRFAGKEEFSQPWHLALWAPRDPQGPTVILNRESPILEEMIRYHQDKFPSVFAEEVEKIVLHVFGEIAACKIAHSQKLTNLVAKEVLERDYRSEEALTLSLMGLIAEETVIALRLRKLGQKNEALASQL